MVAAPVSQPNEGQQDFFSVFGVKRRFGLDKADLETRFYKLSRELHPDRFATSGVAARAEALEKMSLVNEAYRALKDPESRREYFLKLVEAGGHPSSGNLEAPVAQRKAQVPMELAESWFELQEVLMEDPVEGQARLAAFKNELVELREQKNGAIAALEKQIDQRLEELEAGSSSNSGAGDGSSLSQYPKDLFQKLGAIVRDLNYLDSMERDIERISGGKRHVG